MHLTRRHASHIDCNPDVEIVGADDALDDGDQLALAHHMPQSRARNVHNRLGFVLRVLQYWREKLANFQQRRLENG